MDVPSLDLAHNCASLSQGFDGPRGRSVLEVMVHGKLLVPEAFPPFCSPQRQSIVSCVSVAKDSAKF